MVVQQWNYPCVCFVIGFCIPFPQKDAFDDSRFSSCHASFVAPRGNLARCMFHLFCVCRVWRNESLELLYACCWFPWFCIPVLAIFLRFLPSLFPLPSHCGFLRILKYETSQTNYFSAVSLFVSAKDESPGSASPRIPPPMFTLWPSDRNITCQVYWVSYGRKSGMFALGKNISGLNVESRLGY